MLQTSFSVIIHTVNVLVRMRRRESHWSWLLHCTFLTEGIDQSTQSVKNEHIVMGRDKAMCELPAELPLSRQTVIAAENSWVFCCCFLKGVLLCVRIL